MSRLLLDEQPLLIMPRLACAIGLNEAIVLQQIHYWVEINRKVGRNLRDGYYWTYNTYDKWKNQFPFWGLNTIKRAIASLEQQDMIVSGVYNNMKMDRTKWYRVNYNAVESLEQSPLYQNGSMQDPNMGQAIPETTLPKTTNNQNHNGSFSGEKATRPFDGKEEAFSVQAMFFAEYKRYRGKEHPPLKRNQLESVIEELQDFMSERGVGPDEMADMIERYFTSRAMRGNTDYNINHFATHGIMQNLGYSTGHVSSLDL